MSASEPKYIVVALPTWSDFSDPIGILGTLSEDEINKLKEAGITRTTSRGEIVLDEEGYTVAKPIVWESCFKKLTEEDD